MPAPTVEAIQSRELTETGALEFKQQIDLDDPRAKSNLVDDVVAFLNACAGHIVVGVREKGGNFERFVPMTGDADKTVRRLCRCCRTTSIRDRSGSMSGRSPWRAGSCSTSTSLSTR
ncbi:MAG TPA: ATP-binding protein [Caulobacteraceae bacterium]|jgi:hypothetical protein